MTKSKRATRRSAPRESVVWSELMEQSGTGKAADDIGTLPKKNVTTAANMASWQSFQSGSSHPRTECHHPIVYATLFETSMNLLFVKLPSLSFS